MLIATITLGISIVGLILLFVLREYELRTGRFLLAPVRVDIGARAHKVLLLLRSGFPEAAARTTKILTKLMRAYASLGLAKALVVLETLLERVLHRIKTAPKHVASRGEASPFLKEVAAYKRMLDRTQEKKKEGEGQ